MGGFLGILAAVGLGGIVVAGQPPPQPSPVRTGEGAGPLPPAPGPLETGEGDQAREMAARAVEWLRAQQDESGGWSVNPRGPDMPAVTGLVLIGMLDHGLDGTDPAVAAGARYILSFAQDDGGIYDRILPSYNTAICLSALARLGRPAEDPPRSGGVPGERAPDGGDPDPRREILAHIAAAQGFIRGLQYSEVAREDRADEVMRVGPAHPFYGGIGYGRHGRPDNSNLTLAIEAMRESGVPADDPFLRRALVFLQRTQMDDRFNDMPYAEGSRQGGFIYSTSVNTDEIGVGQSFAGEVEKSLDDGRRVSRLRAYGSMTYAGFKSYAWAELDREDPRVLAAWEWIRRNYTVRENPGVGDDGLYYYYMTFAKALDAWGEPAVEAILADGRTEGRDWKRDLVARLAELQNEDGSFRSVHDRWMEADPVLITAYAVIALQRAAGK
jgi:squalene-hopene/tetraprenyl-beta-curcumene cyclase